jgi:hypothetical protein
MGGGGVGGAHDVKTVYLICKNLLSKHWEFSVIYCMSQSFCQALQCNIFCTKLYIAFTGTECIILRIFAANEPCVHMFLNITVTDKILLRSANARHPIVSAKLMFAYRGQDILRPHKFNYSLCRIAHNQNLTCFKPDCKRPFLCHMLAFSLMKDFLLDCFFKLYGIGGNSTSTDVPIPFVSVLKWLSILPKLDNLIWYYETAEEIFVKNRQCQ